ncbi:DUF4230 domain-containing protein [Sphingoaurantiacus capsulatus]|uniref:DUF4230 domain-containing protein n=1 Tax=Sphingoaurantiacus capsulatus TaxID=1771310 RepID=A0ABV7XDU1_9SPHN
MKTKDIAIGAAVVAAASFTAGRVTAPPPDIDRVVRQGGLFSVDASEVITVTLASLRDQNRLQVYEYAAEPSVRVTRSRLAGLISGSQELIVPASVAYHVDLANVGADDVAYNRDTKVVVIELPRLVLGNVAFLPEKARATNGGLLTFDEDHVEELRKLNYAAARKAVVRSAQNPTIVALAERQALKAVQDYFEIPLRVAGHADIRVQARFGKHAT